MLVVTHLIQADFLKTYATVTLKGCRYLLDVFAVKIQNKLDYVINTFFHRMFDRIPR